MSKTIWKYELKFAGVTSLEIPKHSLELSTQIQNGIPVIWFLVDPERTEEIRRFKIYRTGEELPDDPGYYISTFQFGNLVFHVFEVDTNE